MTHRQEGPAAWRRGEPSKPVLDANRELVKESDGKLRYAKVIEFDDREISTRLSDAVVKAVEHHIAAQAFAP
jgi:hypothetical protein